MVKPVLAEVSLSYNVTVSNVVETTEDVLAQLTN